MRRAEIAGTLLALALSACRGSAPSAEEAKDDGCTSVVRCADHAQAPRKTIVRTKHHFEVTLEVPAIHVGESAIATLTLSGRSAFTCDDCVYELSASATHGVELKQTEFTRADAVITDSTVVMKIPFRVTRHGVHSLGGELAFSSCSSRECPAELAIVLLDFYAE